MGDSSSDEDDKDKEVGKLLFLPELFHSLSCFQVEELDPYDGWRISKTCDSIARRENKTWNVWYFVSDVNGDAEENN